MNCALVQLNPVVGALEENTARIITEANAAADAGAQLIVFPELSLCGYPPEDLILRPHFVQDCEKQLNRLANELPKEVFTVVGAPVTDSNGRCNAAIVFHDGKRLGAYRKMLLPNYGVFDEKRVFDAGHEAFTFTAFGKKIGIHICEDSWLPDGMACTALASEQPDLVINLSASPYHRNKRIERENVFSAAAKKLQAPLLFCNQVGGQDELVFDGGSMIFDASGAITARAPLFQESTLLTAIPPVQQTSEEHQLTGLTPLEEVYEALKLGLRDYVNKNGFKKTVVAVSGGIDSALVLTLAVDALGADRVAAVTMP